MLKSYILIAVRNIRRYASHSMLNIAGLSIALAACLVIFLVLQHEYSYDTYHKNASKVYQLVKKEMRDGQEEFQSGGGFPLKKALSNDYPEVEFTQLYTSFGSQVTVPSAAGVSEAKKFLADNEIYFAEQNLDRFFNIHWIIGSAEVLAKPGLVAVSKSKAEKYFGSANAAIGKSLLLDNQLTVQVEAVFDTPPSNTDFNFQLLISYSSLLSNLQLWGLDGMEEDWGLSTSNQQVYALLPEGMGAQQMNSQLEPFAKKYHKSRKADRLTYFLQPLRDVHFDTRFGNNGTHVSSRTSLRTLAFIGTLILLMACINFVNLSTALSVKRGKEVGIRKVMGGTKQQLKLQVLLETSLLVIISSAIAIVLAWSALPFLKHITDIQSSLSIINLQAGLFLLAAIIVTSLLAGLYPAYTVSRFNPIAAIKNKLNNQSVAGLSLRRILVVLQFSFSQMLVIATIIAISQMNFIRDADLGFNKSAVLLLTGSRDSIFFARQPAFKAQLKQLPEVQEVSYSMDAPSSDNTWTSNFAFDNSAEDVPFGANLKVADGQYLATFGLKMAAGEFYNDRDSVRKVVINETMRKRLGVQSANDAVGKTIKIGGSDWVQIAGVVEDFKQNSLREQIKPTILLAKRREQVQANVKLGAGNLSSGLKSVEKIWNQVYPEFAFNPVFLDESIQRFYQQEERLSRLYKVFAGLAIIISCLGLYGLISFMAIQKTKEVGIRKVLGASVAQIIYLFSKEFTILILIAFLISAPVAWYLMNNWLQNFVFKIHIGWWVFAIAIFSSLVIAWITVGYKATQAALANPVKSLKTE